MHDASIPSASRWRLRLSPTRTAAIVYILAAAALWWTMPPSPRLVIHAGPRAHFGGFTPDGQSLLTIDRDLDRNGGEQQSSEPKFIRFWNAYSGQRGPAIEIDGRTLDAVGFAQDGQLLYVGSRYFSATTGEALPARRFVGSAIAVDQAESPDGRTIASCVDNWATVGDALSGEVRFKVLGGQVVAFGADSKTLAVAVDLRTQENGTKTGPLRWAVKFVDPLTGTEQRTFGEHDGYVARMALSPRGDKLALAVWIDAPAESDMRGIQIWDIASGEREQTFPMSSENVSNVGRLRFFAAGQVLSVDGFFRGFVWDLSVPAPNNIVGETGLTATPKVLSSDGRMVADWNDQSKELLVRRLGAGKPEIVSRRDYSEPRASALPIAFTSDGRLIVNIIHSRTSGLGDKIRQVIRKFFPGSQPDPFSGNRATYEVLDPLSGRLLGQVPGGGGSTLAGIAPDGKTLVARDFQHHLRDKFTIWDIPAGAPWLAILGWALLPAAAVGLLQRVRERARTRLVVE